MPRKSAAARAAGEAIAATSADDYGHKQKTKRRPDEGVQQDFPANRKPKMYRYDSSLDPELSWDENAGRGQAEWLLGLIERATEEGEGKVFAVPQVWYADGTRIESLKGAIARLKSLSTPFLNWAGKAERHEIKVPTVPLFGHERHSTKAILETVRHRRAHGTSVDLFSDRNIDIADRLNAYEHMGPWENRMILGDSLQVMNSLLEYEEYGGKVQMIYMDPPYGVKFGSNFQPFVRKRDVKHGRDEDMVREPEMVKAYRDTWELGTHSYLSYLRDRLLLARELLHGSGSIFVQISDENLHLVRQVMDEVLGGENFVSVVTFSKTGGQSDDLLAGIADYLLWFAKDIQQLKYRQLYQSKIIGGDGGDKYNQVELPDGERMAVRKALERFDELPEQTRFFRKDTLTSQRPPGSFPVKFEGNAYLPLPNYWKTGQEGMERLIASNRVVVEGRRLAYVRYHDDFPVFALTNVWADVGGIQSRSDPKIYAVQTSTSVIQRCLLMTTDPGDLVLDPTCGSGTTSYVAEQWGRRWITCDTSRVPLALARQRLLTATFPWYELAQPEKGPEGGFVYKRKQNRKGGETGGLVPHITLKSIANDEEPKMETLVDRPEVAKTITRVTGPFVVEATIPAPADLYDEQVRDVPSGDARTHINRMIEVLRQSHTLRLPGNRTLKLEAVRPMADVEYLHAEALEDNGKPKRIAILFGPQDGAVTSQSVVEAAREAYFLKYEHLYIFGFAIQAKARELAEDKGKLRIRCSYVSVTPDVVMSDLLKTTQSSQIFSVTGLPDIDIQSCKEKSSSGARLYQVELRGLDTFNPADMETESTDGKNLPAWMLDTDYNGMCFYASQVFFPKTSAWDNLKRSLGASLEESVWDHLAGTVSEPFSVGDHRRIAVKVIDERGNELMAVRDVKP